MMMVSSNVCSVCSGDVIILLVCGLIDGLSGSVGSCLDTLLSKGVVLVIGRLLI